MADNYGFDRAGAKRIVDATKLVENKLAPSPQRNETQRSSDEYFVKLGTNISTNKWNAEQVEWDGTDLDEFTEGESWDSDTPLYVVGAVAGEENDVLRAELISSGDDDLSSVWIALKTAGGGGTSAIRIKIISTATHSSGVSFTANLVDEDGTVIQEGDPLADAVRTVVQKKFTTAKFYEDEQLYADTSDNAGVYLLDKYLSGINV